MLPKFLWTKKIASDCNNDCDWDSGNGTDRNCDNVHGTITVNKPVVVVVISGMNNQSVRSVALIRKTAVQNSCGRIDASNHSFSLGDVEGCAKQMRTTQTNTIQAIKTPTQKQHSSTTTRTKKQVQYNFTLERSCYGSCLRCCCCCCCCCHTNLPKRWRGPLFHQSKLRGRIFQSDRCKCLTRRKRQHSLPLSLSPSLFLSSSSPLSLSLP